MSFVTDNLTQTAAMWAPNGKGADGRTRVLSPVDVSCRWQDKIETIKTAQDRMIRIHAWVAVDREVSEGSIMRLGAVGDLPDPVEDGLYYVVDSTSVPTLDNPEEVRRTVMLARYKNELPEINDP